MFRFIKMWLLLRILQYQEEAIIASQQDFLEQYKKGSGLFASQQLFVIECTSFSILRAFLPKKFRKPMKSKTYDESKSMQPDKRKVREFDSLLKLAKNKGFLQSPPENQDPVEVVSRTPKNNLTHKDAIRVSADGDNFITYFGGMEAMIKAFPSLWGIIGLSLIPWLVTNHQWVVSLQHLVTRQ